MGYGLRRCSSVLYRTARAKRVLGCWHKVFASDHDNDERGSIPKENFFGQS